MTKHDVLQHIPFDQEFSYVETRDCYLDDLKDFSKKTSVCGAVNWLYSECEAYMDENGMEKFVIVIAAILFQIDRGEVDSDAAYGAKWDILDFETGKYDDLFKPEDLALIKSDIKRINDYFAMHPEFIRGVSDDRAKTQSK